MVAKQACEGGSSHFCKVLVLVRAVRYAVGVVAAGAAGHQESAIFEFTVKWVFGDWVHWNLQGCVRERAAFRIRLGCEGAVAVAICDVGAMIDGAADCHFGARFV